VKNKKNLKMEKEITKQKSKRNLKSLKN
jgi:hypothetical protein